MIPDWLPGLGGKSCRYLMVSEHESMLHIMCVHVCSVMSSPLWPHGPKPPTQSCPTLCGPVDRKNPCPWDFSRQEYWSGLLISFSRGSSQPRNQIRMFRISCTGRQLLYHCATWEFTLHISDCQFSEGW